MARRLTCKLDEPIDLRGATLVFQLSYAVLEKGDEFTLELPDAVRGAVMVIVRSPQDPEAKRYFHLNEEKGTKKP